jgi:hypothetical protein
MKNQEEKDTKNFRSISIWIDNYDDIFSDFDPRDYSERNISDDFLDELKKLSFESDFPIKELKLLIPEKERNAKQEKTIVKRLHTHFEEYDQYFHEQKKLNNRKGILFVLIGMGLMLAASYISSLDTENIIQNILFVIFEPSSWFLVWTGFDHLILLSKEQKSNFAFYSRISKCETVFTNIEKNPVSEFS